MMRLCHENGQYCNGLNQSIKYSQLKTNTNRNKSYRREIKNNE